MRPSHTPPGTAAGTPARPAAEDIVAVDTPELFARYESSAEGLSSEEAHRRLRRFWRAMASAGVAGQGYSLRMRMPGQV